MIWNIKYKYTCQDCIEKEKIIKELERQRDFWINKDIKNLKRIKEMEKARMLAYKNGYMAGYNSAIADSTLLYSTGDINK